MMNCCKCCCECRRPKAYIFSFYRIENGARFDAFAMGLDEFGAKAALTEKTGRAWLLNEAVTPMQVKAVAAGCV